MNRKNSSKSAINDTHLDPLASLKPRAKKTAHFYLALADEFFEEYSILFPEVFYSSCHPNGEIFNVKECNSQLDKTTAKFEISKNPMIVSKGIDEVGAMVAYGMVPVMSNPIRPLKPTKATKESVQSSEKVAALLALHSIGIVVPATRGAHPETILEAREKLKDQLPPFWSAMLKLSVEIRQTVGNTSTDAKLNRACKEAVATIVRPSLIDLVDKLEKDRKRWFYRILSPVASSMRLLAGRPSLDPSALISASLQLGAGMAVDFSDHARKVRAMKEESGLAYLIELHKQFDRERTIKNQIDLCPYPHEDCAHVRHIMYKMKDNPLFKKKWRLKN